MQICLIQSTPTRRSLKSEMTDKIKKGPKKPRIIRNTIGLITTISTQIICALVISQYDPSHTGTVCWPLSRKICFPPSAISSSCPVSLPMPDWIFDPSSTIFANSVMIFGVAILISYTIQRNIGFQNRVLGYGALLGSFTTGLIAIIEGDGHGIKDYMPAFIILSLLANMLL